jgi:ABC-type transport system involved in multi-copper enzyme maturation permease subunit
VTARVIWTLASATWREKLSHPVLVVLYGVVCFSYTTMAVTGTHALEDPTLFLTVFVAAGTIGREVSSGVLPLLFTRPIVRTDYVIAKWLAVSLAAALLGAVTLLLQAALLARGGAGVAGGEIAAAVFQSASVAFGLASVLICFSVLVPGAGDIAVWLGLSLLAGALKSRLPARVHEEWQALLSPQLDWGASSFAIVSYLSTVTLFLCLAALAANRKELSYAAG